ncbi:LOW QUALITY PROTEIN: reverse transcriptase [Phytophthora megakarya]|uniref:Reverse transcriptase n=1 Tax=Phytophthora megakarya TaxID=4795 RepID=A0A225ULU2_9STRA|nr:LOW QUALITY PROTEIN: reverse transcriptase [Phytophthora megakarya]
MVEMLLESLPELAEFENLKSSVRYEADTSVYTPTKVRELIRAAASRQTEFHSKRGTGTGQNMGQKSAGNKAGAKGKPENQQQQKLTFGSKGSKEGRKCYACGSGDHIRANCPQKTKQNTINAGDNDQSRNSEVSVRSDAQTQLPRCHVMTSGQGVVTGALDTEPNSISSVDLSGQALGVTEKECDAVEDSNVNWWYFDTASNAHVTGNRAQYVSFTEDTTTSQSVHGVTMNLASKIAGVGTVAVKTWMDGEEKVFHIEDVCYVPEAEYGLFSPGLALKQGFDFKQEHATMNFRVAVATPHDSTWGFITECTASNEQAERSDPPICNFTAAEGMAPLKTWHERLGHTCPQYLKTMIDQGLVQGMMLSQRQPACDACHVGKQNQSRPRKKLNRKTRVPNQLVYADLLIPSEGNGTHYEAVVTMHLVKSKAAEVVNVHIKEYVAWAERQARRSQADGEAKTKYPVRQTLTDKGGEFVNSMIASWYASKGIEHVKVGPKSSQLNLCGRTTSRSWK